MTRTTMIAALAITAAAGLATTANAGNILLSEQFNYPDGNLAGNGGWTAHSGVGAMPVQVTGGTAVLNQGSGSREDVNVLTGTTLAAGQTWYAGFDFTNSGGSANVYFAHFFQSTSVFAARTFVTPATGGGDYTLGLSDAGGVPDAGVTWASDLSFGTTYRAVISYSFDTGNTRLWINPVLEGDTNLSTTGQVSRPLTGFALRQSGGDSSQTIDNLIVGDSFAAVVPAPGALALLGLGGLAAARRRRA